MEEASRQTRWAHQHTHIHTQLFMQTHGTPWTGAEPHTGPLRASIMRWEEEGVQAVWWGGQKKISPSHHHSQQAGVREQALITPLVPSPPQVELSSPEDLQGSQCALKGYAWGTAESPEALCHHHGVVHLGSTLGSPPVDPRPWKSCSGPLLGSHFLTLAKQRLSFKVNYIKTPGVLEQPERCPFLLWSPHTDSLTSWPSQGLFCAVRASGRPAALACRELQGGAAEGRVLALPPVALPLALDQSSILPLPVTSGFPGCPTSLTGPSG